MNANTHHRAINGQAQMKNTRDSPAHCFTLDGRWLYFSRMPPTAGSRLHQSDGDPIACRIRHLTWIICIENQDIFQLPMKSMMKDTTDFYFFCAHINIFRPAESATTIWISECPCQLAVPHPFQDFSGVMPSARKSGIMNPDSCPEGSTWRNDRNARNPTAVPEWCAH